RMRVVDAGADADRIEAANDFRALAGQWAIQYGGETVVAVGLVGRGDIEHRNLLEAGEPALERCKIPGATLEDHAEALELFATDRRIDVAEAIVDTKRKHVIDTWNGALGKCTIDTEGPRLGDFL